MQISIKHTFLYGLAAVLLAGCNAQSTLPTVAPTVPTAAPMMASPQLPVLAATQIAIPKATPTKPPVVTGKEVWLTYTHPYGISFRYPASWRSEVKDSEIAYQGFRLWATDPAEEGQAIFVYFGQRQNWDAESQVSYSFFKPESYLRWMREIKRPTVRGVKYVVGPDEQGMILPEMPTGQTFKAILQNTAPNANESGYYLTIETRILPSDQAYAEQVGIDRVIQERYRTFEAIVDSARFPEEIGAPVNTPELNAVEPSIHPYGKSIVIHGSHQIEFDDDVMQVHLAPNQRAFAVYTSGSFKMVGQQTLYVYSFPELELIFKQPLLAIEMINSLRDSGTVQEQLRNPYAAVMHSIIQTSGKQTWSLDGRNFAFAAAFEGPSADLYVFDTQVRIATRLSDGPAQIGGVEWSPDSQWVVHQAIGGFEDSPGWSVDGVWAAPINGDAARLLLRDPQQTPYRIATWVSDQTFLAVPQRENGHADLEYISIAEPTASRRIAELPGYLTSAQYHAETQRIDVIIVRQEGNSQHWSLWSVPLNGGTPEKLKETVNEEIALPK